MSKPLLALIPFYLAAASTASAAPMMPLDMCEMKPVLMEEFDTESIASRTLGYARWTAHTPWNGDFGDARFTDPGPGSAFSVANGMLRITASRGPDGKWRSGLIAASDSAGSGTGVKYGYFETRMKLPPGLGTWPAFWLASIRPPGDPGPFIEIDTIEYYGHMTTTFSSAVHVWYNNDKSRSRHEGHRTEVPDGSLVEQFHTYGTRVAPDMVTFYFDGAPVWEAPTPPELRQPLFPMVNLALGSGWPIDKTPNPSILEVDYVHVYALDGEHRADRCPASAGAKP